jgi:hypothetical protein
MTQSGHGRSFPAATHHRWTLVHFNILRGRVFLRRSSVWAFSVGKPRGLYRTLPRFSPDYGDGSLEAIILIMLASFSMRKLASSSLKAVNFEQTRMPDRLRLTLLGASPQFRAPKNSGRRRWCPPSVMYAYACLAPLTLRGFFSGPSQLRKWARGCVRGTYPVFIHWGGESILGGS